MAARHLKTGAEGESAAESFLRERGYSILTRNWSSGSADHLELDIVCEDGDDLVFVEVRTRRRGGMVSPGETLDRGKLGKLARAASLYLSETEQWDRPCRFDVVSVVMAGETLRLEHVIDAFDLSQALRGRNAAWQPW